MQLPFTLLSRKEQSQLVLEAENLKKESKQAAAFIENIEAGNLETGHNPEITALAEKSQLLSALLKMQEQLKNIARDEKQRNWATEGLAQFVEILRAQHKQASELYDSIIANLVKYLQANQGGLFIVNEDNEDNPFLEMVACYAYNRKKHLHKHIKPGEGLVGQCYREADTIYITDVPEDYVNITSGLGQATPSNILIIPLKLNEKIYGIIELASFKVFERYQVAFAEKLGESIAATVSNTQVSYKTQELLGIAQQQAEEMRATEEEMRQNMEELEATQEEMRRKDVEMSGIFTAINSTLATVEFDMSGKLLTANRNFLKLMGYTLDEVRDKHHHIFVDADYRESAEYAKFWKELNEGKAQIGEIKRITKDGREIWLSASYTPVIDTDGNPLKVIKFAQDVTDKKQAELESQRLSLVADNTDNSVIITNREGNIEYINKGFERMTGYGLSEVIGRKPGDFLQGPDTDKNTIKRIREKINAQQPFSEEILNYDRNGKSYWISLAINPVFNKRGILEKYISVQANITDTKMQALDYNFRLDAIDKSYGVVEFDTEGIIQSANDNFLEIVGYSLEEVKGKHHKIFVEEEEKNSIAYKGFWEKLGTKGEYISGEFKRLTKNGDTVWLKGSYNAILDLQGKPYKVIKYAQNITDQKQLEVNIIKKQQEVIETAGKFEQILEGCADAVITIDEIGTISFFNQTAEKLWGYSRDEIIGKNVRMLMEDEHSVQHDSYLHNYKTTGIAKVLGKGREVEALCKDGKKVPILLTLTESNVNDKSVFTAFIKDITLQRDMENQAQQNMEELKAQEEELRQNMEELTATQEETERKSLELVGLANAISTTLATIEFNMDGTIITANENFLSLMGYNLEEIIGKHHRIFLDSDFARSRDYIKFWDDLNFGKAQVGEVKRIAKDAHEVWLSASYTPVMDTKGHPFKIIKFAQDITNQKRITLDFESQMDAIHKSYAVVEFDMLGNILTANDNFLSLMNYGINEIKGRHHRIFVSDEEAHSKAYKNFWKKLSNGEFVSGEFRRIGKNGKEVLIKGSYSPIADLDGTIYKVVKYAQSLISVLH